MPQAALPNLFRVFKDPNATTLPLTVRLKNVNLRISLLKNKIRFLKGKFRKQVNCFE